MRSCGQVFAVDLRRPIPGLVEPLELMALYPCVYDGTGCPCADSHYLAIVLVKSERDWMQTDVMHELRGYAPFAARYLTHFYAEV